MPASQTVEYQGFSIRARPAFWLRRWTLFPLYFQAVKPSFDIEVTKLGESPSQVKKLRFYIHFANNTSVDYHLDVSSMKIGDRRHVKTLKALLAPTGDASIRLDMGHVFNGAGVAQHFHTLYAFYVSSETALVFLVLNVILVAAATLIIRFVP